MALVPELRRPALATADWARKAARKIAIVADLPVFLIKALYYIVVDIILKFRYGKLIARHVSDIVVGIGGWVIGGGMVFVVGFIAVTVGGAVGLVSQGVLSMIGAQNYVGLITSFTLIRELIPVIAAIALAAQTGSAITAEIGAMRISEEIDALEVMGIRAFTYLICTRAVAAAIAIIPLYLIAIFAGFFAAMSITVLVFDASPQVFTYYFQVYLPPMDVLYSAIKVGVFGLLIILIHCYQGFYASGGPVGVGEATGRAIRQSIVAAILINLFLSYLFWGAGGSVRFAA